MFIEGTQNGFAYEGQQYVSYGHFFYLYATDSDETSILLLTDDKHYYFLIAWSKTVSAVAGNTSFSSLPVTFLIKKMFFISSWCLKVELFSMERTSERFNSRNKKKGNMAIMPNTWIANANFFILIDFCC